MEKMRKTEIKYRTWFKGIPPRPIKLEIPGWAGDSHGHSDGDRPQPWHCPPFVDGATYGLELLYPFDSECHVKVVDGQIKFEGDFAEENRLVNGVQFPPFMSFAPGHFGFTSSLDLKVPPGHILRLEAHPRFYTDTTYTVPLAVPGHIQTEWWPKIFFVVFKQPMPGQTYIFRKNEPYAQVLVLPRKVVYDIKEMTPEEKEERRVLDDKLAKYHKYFVRNRWTDHIGHTFDDKYRILSGIFAKHGVDGINNFLNKIVERVENRKKMSVAKVGRPRVLGLKRNHETVQNQETTTETACIYHRPPDHRPSETNDSSIADLESP